MAVRNSIMSQVSNQYLALAELDERIALATQSRATFQESVRIFKRRFEVGSGAKTGMCRRKPYSATLILAAAIAATA